MENEVVKNNNTMIKTIVFVLVAGLTCLLFFGLGETEKTKPELISFGVLLFSELLIYLSLIIPSKTEHNNLDLLSASVLYAIGAIILKYIIKPAIIKHLIVWNVAIFLVYLIIVVIVTSRKK